MSIQFNSIQLDANSLNVVQFLNWYNWHMEFYFDDMKNDLSDKTAKFSLINQVKLLCLYTKPLKRSEHTTENFLLCF